MLALPKNYEYQINIDDASDVLFIGLSSGKKFQGSLINGNVCLSIIEKNNTFLLYNVGSVCKNIANFAIFKKFRKIIIFGSNSSGYAAIVWSYLLSRFLNNHDVSVNFITINPK